MKSTSYAENVVVLQRAAASGADEAIFANTVGNLCEATGSNVFIGIEGRLITPPLSAGPLAGVTRDLLLLALEAAGAPAFEEDRPMSALFEADEAFLLSTGRQVQPIRRIDDVTLRACPGPLTQTAAKVWHAAYDDAVDP